MTTDRGFLDDIVSRLGKVDKSRRTRPDFTLGRFGDTPGQQQGIRDIPVGDDPERQFRFPTQQPTQQLQPFQQQPQQFPAVSGRATQPLTFQEAIQPEKAPPFRGVVSEPDLPFPAYQKINKAIIEAVNTPLFNVGGVNVSAPDIVSVALIAYMGVKGVQALVGVGKELVDKTTQFAMNKGVDEFIRSLGREVVPRTKLGGVFNKLPKNMQESIVDYLRRNPGLVDRATKNYQQRIGRGVPGGKAVQETSAEMMQDMVRNEKVFVDALIPRGTQSGALAFGGKISPKPVPMPPEVQAEQIARANALLEQVPAEANKITSIPAGEGEIVIRTDSQGQTLVTAQLVLREGQLTASNIVLAPGKGLAGGRAVKEVIEHLQANNIALPPREEMSPEALRIVDKLQPQVEPTPPAVAPVSAPTTPTTPPFETQLGANLRVAFEQPERLGIPPVTPPAVEGVGALKIGDDARILDVDSVLADVKVIGGVRYDLFNGASLKEQRAAVRVTDVDSGEVVTLKQYPNFDAAEREFNTAITGATKVEQPSVTPSPEAPTAIPEGVAPVRPPTTPQAQQVERIQQQGRVAPASVPPEEAKVSHIAKAAPDGPRKPPPPTQPPTVAKPEEPSEILKDILAKQVEGERPDQTVMRLYGAAARNVKRRTGDTVKEGSAKLKEKGIGVTKRGFLVPREKDKPKLLELYNALHNPSKVASGEMAVPAGYDEIYTELRGLADWDTAARLDFDPNAATIEDWFFRGWKPPEGMFGEAQKGALGTKPRALRMPRVGATFEEMIDLGFEPLFWNPYQQWGYRHNLGEIYREQMVLVSHLKSLGDDLIRPDMGGALPAGWKIPKIGPAFEGKPFAAVDGDGKPGVMFTRRWAVPAKTANLLESMFGKRPDIGTLAVFGKTIDPLTIIDWVAFVPKRAKLLLSLFQQQDFLTRSGGGSWGRAIDALISGKPVTAATSALRFPKTALDIIHANLSPAKRLSLSKQLDDTTPIIEGRPGINLKGISEAGLSVMDETIWAAEMDKLMSTVAENTGIWGAIKGAGSSLVDLESAMRRGLFQGVYPAAMITEIKNNIAIMMVKQHPTANDEQINGHIAKEVNKKYSTIPPEQSIIQNTFVRELLRRITFSFGESEALLRQASGMFHGPNKRFWIKENIGQIIFVLVVANIIHFLSTGEPLPEERYNPVAEDNWGPLPFGYNTKFASPTIPWKGRGGTELTVDLMGQMDTAYRVLDPASFISARASVPIRAMVNQVSGTDFYGAPIDDVGPGGVVSRLTQLIYDMFAPIGVGGISTAALRDAIPGETIPRGEERLGLLGLGLQATGVNIRAERTRDLLDRHASESGLFKRDGTLVQNWNDLEPHQKDIVVDDMTLVEELEIRSEISAERGYPGAQGYATLLKLEQQRIKRGEALVTDFNNEIMDPRTFRNEVTKLKLEIASRRSQVDEDFQLYQDNQELPEDLNKRALVEYYSLFDNAKRESGVIDWDRLDRLETQFRARLTPEQRSYVDDNTGLTEWGPLMSEYIEAGELLSPYWEVPEGFAQAEQRRQLRRSSRELDAALVKWYGYKPISGTSIPGFTPPLRVPTRTPSRELVPAGGEREINLGRF